MPPTSNRQNFLQLLEHQGLIGGRFQRVRRLPPQGGNGTFSLIFQADDMSTGQLAILKFFDPDKYAETYRWESFRREAALLQELKGQNDIINQVAPISQLSVALQTTGGLTLNYDFHYYALEPAAGDVLEVIAGGLWNPEQALLGFRSMCRAVARLHRRQITHRDINFLIFNNGEVKLGDLGTACKLDGKTPQLLTNYSGPPGDLRYSAPELFACLHDINRSIAFAADIFSLGGVLFEIFTGSPLTYYVFDPPTLQRLDSIANLPIASRVAEFSAFIESKSASTPLPDLGIVARNVPRSIQNQLNALYQAMARLDWRHRLCDFDRIYNRIEQCLIILRNEEKYKQWRRMKRIRSGRITT